MCLCFSEKESERVSEQRHAKCVNALTSSNIHVQPTHPYTEMHAHSHSHSKMHCHGFLVTDLSWLSLSALHKVSYTHRHTQTQTHNWL